MSGWKEFLEPEDSTVSLERESVSRILTKSGLAGNKAQSFEELYGILGYPFMLTARKFKKYALDCFDKEMRKSPTRTQVFADFDAIASACDLVDQSAIGMVFSWTGCGGIHVMTSTSEWPSRGGTYGRYFQVKNRYYFVETLDSFISRVGNAKEW